MLKDPLNAESLKAIERYIPPSLVFYCTSTLSTPLTNVSCSSLFALTLSDISPETADEHLAGAAHNGTPIYIPTFPLSIYFHLNLLCIHTFFYLPI